LGGADGCRVGGQRGEDGLGPLGRFPGVVGETHLDAPGRGVDEGFYHRLGERGGEAEVVDGEVEGVSGLPDEIGEARGDGLGLAVLAAVGDVTQQENVDR
jgi:hypothetical protein